MRSAHDLRLDEMTREQQLQHVETLKMDLAANVACGARGFAIVVIGDGNKAMSAYSVGISRSDRGVPLPDVQADTGETLDLLIEGLRREADRLQQERESLK